LSTNKKIQNLYISKIHFMYFRELKYIRISDKLTLKPRLYFEKYQQEYFIWEKKLLIYDNKKMECDKELKYFTVTKIK